MCTECRKRVQELQSGRVIDEKSSKDGSDGVKMKVEKFEDLVIWQMSREISRNIYRITNVIHQRDYGFCDQIRRAIVSVMNNISEGYERGSNKDFVKFLFIARGSCGEVRSMLCVALDQHYIEQEEFDKLSGQCRQCSGAIWGLIKSLNRTGNWKEQAEITLMLLLPLLALKFVSFVTL